MNSVTGKYVIALGGLIVFVGIVIYFFHNRLHWIGNLPGDIKVERENFRLYFPITTMILVSVLLTIIVRIWRWLQ